MATSTAVAKSIEGSEVGAQAGVQVYRGAQAGVQVYRGTQVYFAISAIVHAIVAEPQYFGAHALLPNRSAGRMEVSG